MELVGKFFGIIILVELCEAKTAYHCAHVLMASEHDLNFSLYCFQGQGYVSQRQKESCGKSPRAWHAPFEKAESSPVHVETPLESLYNFNGIRCQKPLPTRLQSHARVAGRSSALHCCCSPSPWWSSTPAGRPSSVPWLWWSLLRLGSPLFSCNCGCGRISSGPSALRSG
jgi:hypothetical protein